MKETRAQRLARRRDGVRRMFEKSNVVTREAEQMSTYEDEIESAPDVFHREAAVSPIPAGASWNPPSPHWIPAPQVPAIWALFHCTAGEKNFGDGPWIDSGIRGCSDEECMRVWNERPQTERDWQRVELRLIPWPGDR